MFPLKAEIINGEKVAEKRLIIIFVCIGMCKGAKKPRVKIKVNKDERAPIKKYLVNIFGDCSLNINRTVFEIKIIKIMCSISEISFIKELPTNPKP